MIWHYKDVVKRRTILFSCPHRSIRVLDHHAIEFSAGRFRSVRENEYLRGGEIEL
jgi:hypothetical protein